MGRPLLWRRVNFIPPITYFKPAGVPLTALQEVCLSVEEAEAIRLKDLEGLEQEKCAERMSVSRSTFARVLASARQKMADALLNGKAIRIEGGNFEMALSRFRCITPPQVCPTCNTPSIMPLQPLGPRWGRGGRGHRRGGRNW